MTIPRQLFTVCDGNLAECIMTQIKINIKIHLHHINGCNRKKAACRNPLLSVNNTTMSYVGPYKYYIKRHIESIHLKEILECEHCGAIYNKSKK